MNLDVTGIAIDDIDAAEKWIDDWVEEHGSLETPAAEAILSRIDDLELRDELIDRISD
jgi:hypothetical protein